MQIKESFEGVFYFTNWTDEDFVVLWNNKEYRFLAKTRAPLIIPGEPMENVQEIRKKFAFKLAQREFYKSKEYNRLKKMGQGLPPTYDEKTLEPMIEKALQPLPIKHAQVKELPKQKESQFKASKAIGEKDNPNFVFKDEVPEEKGVMPDTVTL